MTAFRAVKMFSFALLLSWLWPAAALPQASSPPAPPESGDTIGGGDVVWLQRQPTMMRVFVELLGKGSTLEEALANLKERRTTVRAQLDKLQADKESVSFGAIAIVNTETSEQQRLEAAIVERLAERGRKAPKTPKAKPMTVSSVLTAQWPLKAGTPEELILTVHQLEEKIKAADLAGIAVVQKLSPEEEELAEETAAAARNSYGQDRAPIGTPRFVFVAKISAQERDKAKSEAFAKAVQDAEKLAKLAGVKLGSLASIYPGQVRRSSVDYSAPPLSDAQKEYLRQKSQDPDTEEMGEIVGDAPGPLTLGITVSVGFHMIKTK